MVKLTQQQAIQWAHEVGLINKEDYAPAFMGSLAEDIQYFASVAYEAGRKDEREANARRIAACLNFCNGLRTEAIEELLADGCGEGRV